MLAASEFTWFSSTRSQGNKEAFDANEISTLAFRLGGSGHSGQSKWAEVFNMPAPPDRKCGKAHTEHILEAAEEVKVSMARAAAEINGEADTADIAVSYDGSWSQRGFTASCGFGSVVANTTGKILDYHVASKVCSECSSWARKDPEHESSEWQAWKDKHDEECTLNHVGFSKAMEADIAEVLWMRSLEEHHLRYTIFVGDGDGSSFGRVHAVKPYGKEVEVIKEDCIGHIQKRMGTQLQEIKRS